MQPLLREEESIKELQISTRITAPGISGDWDHMILETICSNPNRPILDIVEPVCKIWMKEQQCSRILSERL